MGADLTAAQQAASTEPVVAVTIENTLLSIRRLDQTVLDTTANTIGKHDVAVSDSGVVIRIRSDNAGGILYQRNATPGTFSVYAGAWTTLVTGRGNLVAIAAKGTRFMLVYNNAAGTTIHWRESTDDGATFGAEQSIPAVATTPADLAVAYKNTTGDCLIAWVRSTQTVGIKRRVGGAFGANTETTINAATLTGIAMCMAGDYEMLITGTELTTTHATVWSYIYGDGLDVTAGNFDSAARVQHQAESDALITYSDPTLCYLDTFRYAFLEADAFTGGNTRVYRSHLHPNNSWSGAAFTHRSPLPFNFTGSKGIAIATEGTAGYLYETAPNYVSRAPAPSSVTTLTSDVVAVEIEERPTSLRGHIDLDNSTGLYAGPPAGNIQIGNLVKVKWGYYCPTTGTNITSQMQDLWLAGYEYRRSGGRSVLRLHLEGAWEVLARSRQHGQLVNSGLSYLTIIARVLYRAGLYFTSSAPSSRSTTVTPAFVIPHDASAKATVLRALDYLADRLRWRTLASCSMTEPLAAAGSDYTFGALHPLNEYQLVNKPPEITEASVIGAAAWGESIDFANAGIGLGTRALVRDANSATAPTVTATAVANLRQRALDAPAGVIVAPPNCGQEVLDLVDVTDLYVNAAAVKRRVQAIRWRYDRHAGKYEQTLTLGAA